jgi:hypothetical protein
VASQGLVTMERMTLFERQCPVVEARTHGESLSTWGCAQGSLNTPVSHSMNDRSLVIQNAVRLLGSVRVGREMRENICQKQGKGMNDVPTVAYYVHSIRNSGYPTGCESYGYGVSIVVDGVTTIRGDGNAGHRAK